MIAETKRQRVELNEPGVHPFVSFLLPDDAGSWLPAVILGARQLRHSHRGSSFPRLFCDGEEEDHGDHIEVRGAPGDGSVVTVSDTRSAFEIASEVTIEGDGPVIHVVHTLRAVRDVGLNRVFDRYDFITAQGAGPNGGPDYSFVPHLRPMENMLIGDHVFRSPVIMMQHENVFFAVVPDLELMTEAYRSGPARYYMDFVVSGGENHSPAVCFGLGRTRPTGHVYFDAAFRRAIDVGRGESLTLGYYLIIDRGGFTRSDMLDFLWERFGRTSSSVLPQTASWDRYASAGLSRMFKRSDLFRKFEMDGQPCGGTVGIHLLNRRGVRLMGLRELNGYLRFQDVALFLQRAVLERLTSRPAGARLLERAIYRYGPKVPPQILFQSWFNNMRSAYGAYWFARRWKDHELLERALAVKNLVILAPREKGAFPAVCYATEDGPYWSRGTCGFKHIDWYNTADCATTAYYMVLWFRDHEGDPRLLGRCREFAEFLLEIQLPSGAFPAWVQLTETTPRVSPDLREGATTACPAMFLAMLYTVDNDPRYLESATKACDFLASEVIPGQKWFDFETFYSCSRKRLGMFDAYTGSYPQNTLSMYWAAEAFRLVFEATGDARYLELGTTVLDHLCLYQQVWDTPLLSVNTFGGFGVMNTDAEWNDSRQAIFAPLLMDYYRLTGRVAFMERGIAALRASFTLMYLDENRGVAPANMAAFKPEERGSVAENYGHFGYDLRTSGYLESDWGPGTACQAAAYVQRHYGDILVDTDNMKAFGINGCRVTGVHIEDHELSLDVDKQVDSVTNVVIKVMGSAPVTGVNVNGKPAVMTLDGDYRTLLR